MFNIEYFLRVQNQMLPFVFWNIDLVYTSHSSQPGNILCNCLSYERISNIDMSSVVEKTVIQTKKRFPFYFTGLSWPLFWLVKVKCNCFHIPNDNKVHLFLKELFTEQEIFDCMFGFTKIFDSEINNVIRIKLIVVFLVRRKVYHVDKCHHK